MGSDHVLGHVFVHWDRFTASVKTVHLSHINTTASGNTQRMKTLKKKRFYMSQSALNGKERNIPLTYYIRRSQQFFLPSFGGSFCQRHKYSVHHEPLHREVLAECFHVSRNQTKRQTSSSAGWLYNFSNPGNGKNTRTCLTLGLNQY